MYLFVTSDPFLRLPPRPVFSPLFSMPSPAYPGQTPCLFNPKKGRGKTYFKTDLFYAFVKKANLFSKCQCLNGIGKGCEEAGAAAPRSRPCALPSIPMPAFLPTPPVGKGLVPRAPLEGILPGQGVPLESWSKDLMTLSALDDPLRLSDVNPLEGAVCSCAHRGPPCDTHAPQTGCWNGQAV